VRACSALAAAPPRRGLLPTDPPPPSPHHPIPTRTQIGYRLSLVRLEPAAAANASRRAANASGPPPLPRLRSAGYKEFVTGYVIGDRGLPKDDQVAWGRPVDVLQLPDGSLLISDDGAHTVFRLQYTGRSPAPGAGLGADGSARPARSGAETRGAGARRPRGRVRGALWALSLAAALALARLL
jgi:hypothetical protein